jgi:hypothetical protein
MIANGAVIAKPTNGSAAKPGIGRDRLRATDAEKSVLCSMLIDDRCIPDVLSVAGATDFQDFAHAAIFREVERRHRSGEPLDVVLILEALRTSAAPGVDYRLLLAEISQAEVTAAHAKHYAGIVRDASRRNRLLDLADEIALRARSSESIDAAIVDAHCELESELQGAVSQAVTFKRLSCRELAAGDFETRFLIDRTLVAGQPLIIAGPQKSLKTSIIVDAALSLATATPMLGRLEVPEAVTVAVMSGESGLATLQETARRIAVSKGHELADIDRVIWSPDVPLFGNHTHAEALRAFLTADGVEVVIVDPAYLALPGADAGNLMIQGALLRDMAMVCDDCGATMVLAHHTNKNASILRENEALQLEDIAWAGFKEFARQWWLLSRREKYQPGSGEHHLWLSVGGSAGHSEQWAVDVSEGVWSRYTPRHWDVALLPASEAIQRTQQQREAEKAQREAAKAEQKIEADREAILRAMTRLGQPETQTAIAKDAGISNARCGAVMDALIASGDVRAATVKRTNKQTYGGFELCSK